MIHLSNDFEGSRERRKDFVRHILYCERLRDMLCTRQAKGTIRQSRKDLPQKPESSTPLVQALQTACQHFCSGHTTWLTICESVHSLCGARHGMPRISAYPFLGPLSSRTRASKCFRRPRTSGGTKADLTVVWRFQAAVPRRM
jgi:hypothetical protein